jgi:hypothetical protein
MGADRASGVTYITDAEDSDLFLLNLSTGQATWIGSMGGSTHPFTDLTLTYRPSYGIELYGIRANGGFFRIDTTTAVQTPLFPTSYTALDFGYNAGPWCYANCDESLNYPYLTPNDFTCFLMNYNNGTTYTNCDGMGGLTGSDFMCFLFAYNNGGCY